MDPIPINYDSALPGRVLPLELYPVTGDDYATAQAYSEEMQQGFAAHVRHNRVMRYEPYFFSLQDGTPYNIPNVDFTEEGRITARDLYYIRNANLLQRILDALEGRDIASVTVDNLGVNGIPRDRFSQTLREAQGEAAQIVSLIAEFNRHRYQEASGRTITLTSLADLNRLLRSPHFYEQWRGNTLRRTVILTNELWRLIDFPRQRIIPRSYFSDEIWNNLVRDGFIDNDGNVLPGFDESAPDFAQRFSTATAALSPLQKTAVLNMLRQAQAYIMVLNRLLLEATYPSLCPQLNPRLTFRPLQDPDRNDIDGDGNCAEFVAVSEAEAYFLNDEILLHDEISSEYFYRLYLWGQYALRRDTIPYGFYRSSRHAPWNPIDIPISMRNPGLAWRHMENIQRDEGGVIFLPNTRRHSMNSAADDIQIAEAAYYAHLYSLIAPSNWYFSSPDEARRGIYPYRDEAQQFAAAGWNSYVIERYLPQSYAPSYFYATPTQVSEVNQEAEGENYIIYAPVFSAGFPDFNYSGEINFSYFFVGPFGSVFPLIDPRHNWGALSDSSLDIIFNDMIGNMPVDWRGMDRFGNITNSSVFYRLTNGAYWDGQRIDLRMAEACSYFRDQRACEYFSYQLVNDECESPGPICTYLDLMAESPDRTLPAGIRSDGTPVEPDRAIPESYGIEHPRAFSDCSRFAAVYFSGNSPDATSLYQQVDERTRCYSPGIPGDEECPAGGPAANQLLYWYDRYDTEIGDYSRDCRAPLLPHTFDGYYAGELCGQAYYLASSAFPTELTTALELERATQETQTIAGKPAIPTQEIEDASLSRYFRDATRWQSIRAALVTTGLVNSRGEILPATDQYPSLELFHAYVDGTAAFRSLDLHPQEIARIYRALHPSSVQAAGQTYYLGSEARRQLSQRELADNADIDQLRDVLELLTDTSNDSGSHSPTQPILQFTDVEGNPYLPSEENYPQLARLRQLDTYYHHPMLSYFSDFSEYYNNAVIVLSAFAQQAIEQSHREDIYLALSYTQQIRDLSAMQTREMFAANPYNQARLDLIEATLRSQIRIMDYITPEAESDMHLDSRDQYLHDLLNFYQTGIDQATSAIQGFLAANPRISRPDYSSITNALITIGDLYMRMHEVVEREGYPSDFPNNPEYYIDRAEEFYSAVASLEISIDEHNNIIGTGLNVFLPIEGIDFSATPAEIVEAIHFNFGIENYTEEEIEEARQNRDDLPGRYISLQQHDEAMQAMHLQLGAAARARSAALFIRRRAVRTLSDTLYVRRELELAVADLEVSSPEDDDFSLTGARVALADMDLFWADLTRSQLWPGASPDLIGDEGLLSNFEALSAPDLSETDRNRLWQEVFSYLDHRPNVFLIHDDIEIVDEITRVANGETHLTEQVTQSMERRLEGLTLSESDILNFISRSLNFLDRNESNPNANILTKWQMFINLLRVMELFSVLHPELEAEITPAVAALRQYINNTRLTAHRTERLRSVSQEFNQNILDGLNNLYLTITNRISHPAASLPTEEETLSVQREMTYTLRYTMRLRIFDFIQQVTESAQDIYFQVPADYLYLYTQANVKTREGAIRSGRFRDRELSYLLPRFTDSILSDSPLEEGDFLQVQDDYYNLVLLVGSATQVTLTQEGYNETLVRPEDLNEAERLARRVIRNSDHIRRPFSIYFKMHAKLKLAEIMIRREEAMARQENRTANYDAVIPIFQHIMRKLSRLSTRDINLMSFRPYSFMAELFHEWANASTAGAEELGRISLYMCYLSDAPYDLTDRTIVLLTRFPSLERDHNRLKILLGNAGTGAIEEETD